MPSASDAFQSNGYCILPDFISSAQIEALKQRALQIIEEFEFADSQQVFSTLDDATTQDAYFLGSADKIRCFLEADALAPDGSLNCERQHAFNKIGHALHDLDPVFDAFSRHPNVAHLVRELGINDPLLWQSMYIFKPPRVGGEVSWHQDATFLHTDPITVTTLWFALDDATVDNGCLWIGREGRNAPLRERFILTNGTTRTVPCHQTPWPDTEDAIPLEVKAGSLICFSGTVPHYSAANRSATARHAYTLHITDARSKYAADNWLQRPVDFPVRGF